MIRCFLVSRLIKYAAKSGVKDAAVKHGIGVRHAYHARHFYHAVTVKKTMWVCTVVGSLGAAVIIPPLFLVPGAVPAIGEQGRTGEKGEVAQPSNFAQSGYGGPNILISTEPTNKVMTASAPIVFAVYTNTDTTLLPPSQPLQLAFETMPDIEFFSEAGSGISQQGSEQSPAAQTVLEPGSAAMLATAIAAAFATIAARPECAAGLNAPQAMPDVRVMQEQRCGRAP